MIRGQTMMQQHATDLFFECANPQGICQTERDWGCCWGGSKDNELHDARYDRLRAARVDATLHSSAAALMRTLDYKKRVLVMSTQEIQKQTP